MKSSLGVLLLIVALVLVGCGSRPTDGPKPLSVADWKALPVDQKYTAEILERLKEGNPSLQTAEGWEAFSRTTLLEQRRKDFKGGKRRP